jgi:hypothetical protein
MTSMITYINVYVPKLATSYMVSNYQCPLPLLRDKIRGCFLGLELEAEGPGRVSTAKQNDKKKPNQGFNPQLG